MEISLKIVWKLILGDGRLHTLLILPIYLGADRLCAVEDLGKITQRGETQQLGDLGHGKICFSQQVLALFNAF